MTAAEEPNGPPDCLRPLVERVGRIRARFLKWTFSKPVSSFRWVLRTAFSIGLIIVLWPVFVVRLIFGFIFAERPDDGPKTIQGARLVSYDEALAEAERLYPDGEQRGAANDATRPE